MGPKTLGLFALISVAIGSPLINVNDDADVDLEAWEAFKLEHNKVYATKEEEEMRRGLWRENLAHINERNSDNSLGFTLAMNQFGDMSTEEFSKKMLMPAGMIARATEKRGKDILQHPKMENRFLSRQVPSHKDWRMEQAVTPIKDQGHCGSCYAFSTTGAIEGQYAMKKGNNLTSFSEQQIVDCTDNNGCHGGWMEVSYEYIAETNGLVTEEQYPYRAMEDKCHYELLNQTTAAHVISYHSIPQGNEEILTKVVAYAGPVSVAIAFPHTPDAQLYKKGMFPCKPCSAYNLNHAVLVVGYGETKDGQQYYLVKNSWGMWGNKGYFWIRKFADNACGIATRASIPHV